MLTLFALVEVLRAVVAPVAGVAVALVGAVDGRCVALGARVARIRGAVIVQVTQKTCGNGRGS